MKLEYHTPKKIVNGVKAYGFLPRRTDEDSRYTIIRYEGSKWACSCKDWMFRHKKACKHIKHMMMLERLKRKK